MNPVETVNLKPPQQLYLDWEGAHWAAREIDLSRDPADWQFYARFQDEVISDPAAIGAHVARAREVLGDPFAKIFDEALVGVLGVEDGALAEFGLGALNRRLALIGVSLDG